MNRKRALWFPQGQFEAPSGCIFKLRATPRPGYVFETRFFEKSVDSEIGFVRREYRLVLFWEG